MDEETEIYEERIAICLADNISQQVAEAVARASVSRWLERNQNRKPLSFGEEKVKKEEIVLKFSQKYKDACDEELMLAIEKAIAFAYEQGQKASGSRKNGPGKAHGSDVSTCRDCGADVIWAKNKNGKNIPLDAELKATDWFQAEVAPGKNRSAYYIRGTGDEKRAYWLPAHKLEEPAHPIHFETCAKRSPPAQDDGQQSLPSIPADDDVAF